MSDFFSSEVGQSIPWFGLTHVLILVGFIGSLVLIWIFGPKLKDSKYEKWVRYVLLILVLIFEFKIFESRMLNDSLFRIPLCGIALYGLTYAIAFKNEKVYKIFYFYAFGTLLTFLFFDTVWGLDRWSGWTYFGAHAAIGWFAVYGYRVLGYTPMRKDLNLSMIYFAIYTFIAGYAYYRFEGADELFLFHAPADFMNPIIEFNQIVYLIVLVSLAILFMFGMYSPIYLTEKKKTK